jgi:hypothetical protein
MAGASEIKRVFLIDAAQAIAGKIASRTILNYKCLAINP